MKKLIILIIITAVAVSGFAAEASITWNVMNNISDFIQVRRNVERQTTKTRSVTMGIEPECYGVKNDTEMYLPFESNRVHDETGRYSSIYSQFLISENRSHLGRAAYFLNDDDNIEICGDKTSFFQPGVNLESWTLQYWVYPVTSAFNEELVKIGRQYYNKEDNEVYDQSVINRIEDGHLVCDFNYIFTDNDKYIPNINIKSYNRINPDKWNHICMTFDAFTGIIRAYINGMEEAVGISTSDGTLDGSVYDMRFHPTNRCVIKIAKSFTGVMDEFYIFHGVKNDFRGKYSADGGEVISKVLQLDQYGGVINKIITKDIAENNSTIRYYYRISDEPFKYDVSEELMPWKTLKNAEFGYKPVRFIQFRIEMLPGTDNNTTPLFRELTINYDKNLPPSRPVGVKVMPADGKIQLKWVRNSELDTKGYKIYYGTKSGSYFGERTVTSPIIVDSDSDFDSSGVTIGGLNNNTIYYFAVTAFDDAAGMNESDFSDEVCCRPAVGVGL